ncbi:hypothetical protein ATANTOWER_021298 [Ataeniobius toweri]|uniref:Uncharacterized protein n=1 Tax=Ataeniobius toweri TaxID=208326 RepID=A0ABU7A319_9TELE|nr:hypothetical protein [Ataeniobius toweri]
MAGCHGVNITDPRETRLHSAVLLQSLTAVYCGTAGPRTVVQIVEGGISALTTTPHSVSTTVDTFIFMYSCKVKVVLPLLWCSIISSDANHATGEAGQVTHLVVQDAPPPLSHVGETTRGLLNQGVTGRCSCSAAIHQGSSRERSYTVGVPGEGIKIVNSPECDQTQTLRFPVKCHVPLSAVG